MTDFTRIAYLEKGNKKQQEAYKILTENHIMEILAEFRPILTGTIPIGIDIDNSDLDIVCYCSDREPFIRTIKTHFSDAADFEILQYMDKGKSTVVCRFRKGNFLIELFAQDTLTTEQQAYRHMLIEERILKEKGEAFRKEIIALKKQGLKTEPAFALLLGLPGDPYQALLQME